MPKMKTHKGAAKRIKRTGSGKFARTKAMSNHFFSERSEASKRGRRAGGMVHPSDEKRIREMVTYI